MKTTDILLDAQFSLNKAKRNGHIVTITGVKFTLEITLSTITRGFNSFCVYDPDGDLFTNYDSVMVANWIRENVLDNIPEDSGEQATSDYTFSVGMKYIQGNSFLKVVVKADSKEDAENFGLVHFGEPDNHNSFLRVSPILDSYKEDFDIRLVSREKS